MRSAALTEPAQTIQNTFEIYIEIYYCFLWPMLFPSELKAEMSIHNALMKNFA